MESDKPVLTHSRNIFQTGLVLKLTSLLYYLKKTLPEKWMNLYSKGREIFIQGEAALQLVQLSISFWISCFEKHNFHFLLFQQPSLKLIDNCTSGSAPSPCIEISLVKANIFLGNVHKIYKVLWLSWCNCTHFGNYNTEVYFYYCKYYSHGIDCCILSK